MKLRFKNLIYGIALGVISEMILYLADAVDEFIFDEDCFLSFLLMLLLPIAGFVFYLVHLKKKKPDFRQLLPWHCGFALTGLIFFYTGSEQDMFLFEQTEERCDWLCLNGIEYMLYPAFVVGGFLILAVLFHIIKWIVMKVKKG